MTNEPAIFQQFFAPQAWSPLRRFSRFIGPPFNHREVGIGTRAALNHLEKFELLAALANRLSSSLEDDHLELEKRGFSPAVRSREFAAIVETLILELYATLDGVRRAMFGAFTGVRGVQNKSTERLFKLAAEGAYGDGFPELIRTPLASAWADWFPGFRRLRTQLAHGETGSCHLNQTSGSVSYMHNALGTNSRALVIEDVVDAINTHATNVRLLTDIVFTYLYAQLELKEREVMCGVYRARLYMRVVAPEPDLTFDSGRCVSRTWFEREPGLACPLRLECGAFASADQPAADGGQ